MCQMSTKTKIIILIFCILPVGLVKAQRKYFPYFNQYRFDGMVMNPAFAGSREVNSASIFYKQRLIGFEGSPSYQTISLHGPIEKINSGLGLLVLHESYALYHDYDFFANYSYRINLFAGKLSLGLKAGATYKTLDDGGLRWPGEAQQNIQKETAFLPNFGVGFFYYSRKFFLGGSLPLILSEENSESVTISLTNNPDNYNYFINSGVRLGKRDGIKFIPSLLVLYVKNSPLFYMGNLNAEFFDETFSVGTGYSSGKALMFTTQLKVMEKIWFGFTYENTLFGEPESLQYINQTYEVMLRFEFKNVIKASSPTDF